MAKQTQATPELQVVTHFVRPVLAQPAPKAPVGKQLHITLVDRNAPTYEFIGEWGGRDIMVVARTIVRAYRKEQLAKRHTASEHKLNTSTIGESNG